MSFGAPQNRARLIRRSGHPRPVRGCSRPPIPYPGGNRPEGYRRRGFFPGGRERERLRGAVQPPAGVLDLRGAPVCSVGGRGGGAVTRGHNSVL